MLEPTFSVSEFVAVFNQTIEFAYPNVNITGELANFKISKNKWVYFDLKDDNSSVRFFGNIYQLPGPLEDGILLSVKGVPRLHPLYGFSISVISMQPTGEGSIKKAKQLLQAKLEKEGLFDIDRKRPLPFPPKRIGLITSSESAAYHDFMKILDARWVGIEVMLADVQVQGELAVDQITQAISSLNQLKDSPDVIVITRGGGSPEDLQAFNTEIITRTVASSRIPTMVAIGHETDVSLAELASDQRASTPSNAAELLVPDRKAFLIGLETTKDNLFKLSKLILERNLTEVSNKEKLLSVYIDNVLDRSRKYLVQQSKLLNVLNPESALKRGYAILKKDNLLLRSGKSIKPGDILSAELSDSILKLKTIEIRSK